MNAEAFSYGAPEHEDEEVIEQLLLSVPPELRTHWETLMWANEATTTQALAKLQDFEGAPARSRSRVAKSCARFARKILSTRDPASLTLVRSSFRLSQ